MRAKLNAELRHAEQQEGRSLEWTGREVLVIEAAMAAADRAEELQRLWRRELARAEPRPSTLTKLAAEARLSERAAVDLAHRVNPGLGQAKSERHVRAGRARWASVPPVT